MKLHAFERSGYVGPFSLVGVISSPSPALAEANPTAYNLACRSAHEQASKFGVHLGSCNHCGMSLTHNAIVKHANGYMVVGLDCAGKVGDSCLADAAKVEQANIRREQQRIKAEEKRQARHAAWLDRICHTGETNREREAREERERVAEQNALREKRDKIASIVKPVADLMADGKGGFRDSIASDLSNGRLPSGYGLSLTCEIYGKQFGRKNSKAYEKANNEAYTLFAEAENVR